MGNQEVGAGAGKGPVVDDDGQTSSLTRLELRDRWRRWGAGDDVWERAREKSVSTKPGARGKAKSTLCQGNEALNQSKFAQLIGSC